MPQIDLATAAWALLSVLVVLAADRLDRRLALTFAAVSLLWGVPTLLFPGLDLLALAIGGAIGLMLWRLVSALVVRRGQAPLPTTDISEIVAAARAARSVSEKPNALKNTPWSDHLESHPDDAGPNSVEHPGPTWR